MNKDELDCLTNKGLYELVKDIFHELTGLELLDPFKNEKSLLDLAKLFDFTVEIYYPECIIEKPFLNDGGILIKEEFGDKSLFDIMSITIVKGSILCYHQMANSNVARIRNDLRRLSNENL